MRTRTRELISSGIWTALGFVVILGARQYSLGTLGNPGPGFFPLVLGCLLASLSGIVFLKNLKQKLTEQDPKETRSFFPEPSSAKRVIIAYVNLCFFRLALQFLGFLLSVFFFSFFSVLAIEPLQWRKSLIFSILSALGNHLLFSVWLQIEFPSGILGL